MFNATFASGERIEGPFTVLLDYKRAEPSGISGYVLGNNRTAARLVFPNHEAAFRSVSDEHAWERISCPRVRFRALYRSSFSETDEGLTALAGTFVADVVDTHNEQLASSDASFTATFSLAGPEHAWNVWAADPFNPSAGFENAAIEGIDQRFQISLEPDTLSWPDKLGVTSTQITRLVVKEAGVNEDREAQLWDEATALADDLTLLVSLLSDASVSWYDRSLICRTGRIQRRRANVTWTRPEDVFSQDLPVDEPRDFLRVAIPALRAWRSKGVELAGAIGYLLQAAERARGSNAQKFASAYLALENVIAIFGESTGQTFTLDSEQFAMLEPQLSASIKMLISDPEVRRRLYEKLRDLNRPAFSTLLAGCLRAHDVEWRDLYPDHHTLQQPAFIKLRNELFHTGSPASVSRLQAETLRVRAVTHRLLLRFLGWTKEVRWPPDHRYMYLRRFWGDEAKGSV